MFKWLFKNHVKEEIESRFKKLHFHLSNSFHNVKKDMDSLSSGITAHHEKSKHFEQRLQHLEKQILLLFSQRQTPQEKIEELPSPPSISFKPETILDELTYTQQRLLFHISNHQKALNTPLSTKSIAKILYKGRKYESVRTTVTEYLDILASHGLIKKVKKRRQNYSHVTERGEILVKKLKKDKKIKETVEIDDF